MACPHDWKAWLGKRIDYFVYFLIIRSWHGIFLGCSQHAGGHLVADLKAARRHHGPSKLNHIVVKIESYCVLKAWNTLGDSERWSRLVALYVFCWCFVGGLNSTQRNSDIMRNICEVNCQTVWLGYKYLKFYGWHVRKVNDRVQDIGPTNWSGHEPHEHVTWYVKCLRNEH